MTRKGESIKKIIQQLEPIYFPPRTCNLLVMPNFSEGVLFFFCFLVPLILYSTCEDKGNVSSIFKCLEHAYGEGERMKEPTFTLSLYGLPKPY